MLEARRNKVLAEIYRLAAAELELQRLPGPDEPLIDALQLDSLRRFTLVVALEDRFRVILPDDQLERVRTLAELSRLVALLMPAEVEARL